ncbi:sugar nucleotide-binding protein [Streptomyces venezuelae]|uniref:sugar nucleotide-binding protein n=1 Tax=Streptomyces venezuelae TaxID=54571 RepID=UPI00341E8BB6
MVHESSDAVFSGGRSPYAESSRPGPVSPYGAAKAAAETAVRLIAPGAVAARTSLIVGNGDSEHERLVHGLIQGTRTGDWACSPCAAASNAERMLCQNLVMAPVKGPRNQGPLLDGRFGA